MVPVGDGEESTLLVPELKSVLGVACVEVRAGDKGVRAAGVEVGATLKCIRAGHTVELRGACVEAEGEFFIREWGRFRRMRWEFGKFYVCIWAGVFLDVRGWVGVN